MVYNKACFHNNVQKEAKNVYGQIKSLEILHNLHDLTDISDFILHCSYFRIKLYMHIMQWMPNGFHLDFIWKPIVIVIS